MVSKPQIAFDESKAQADGKVVVPGIPEGM
jgi:hypothetical protein